jgi:ABC-type branched-subunit amino acid transport system substrate-binding protein
MRTMSINRRAFLTQTSTWGILGVLGVRGVLPLKRAAAQSQPPRTVRVAHLSPRGGSFAEQASYAIMGAQLGAEEANTTAAMFGTRVELIVEDGVGPEQIIPTAGKLMGQTDMAAIIGAPDDQGTSVLSELTQRERVVFVNAAARGGTLRGQQCHRYTLLKIALFMRGGEGQLMSYWWRIRNDREFASCMRYRWAKEEGRSFL